MALNVIYWRDIPTQVSFGKGRKAIKRPLADRFLVAVDKAAMKAGLDDTDAYLAQWHKVAVEIDGEEPSTAVERIALELEDTFPTKQLAQIAENGGKIKKG